MHTARIGYRQLRKFGISRVLIANRAAEVVVYQISRERVMGSAPWSVGRLAAYGRGLRTNRAAGRRLAPSEPPRPHRTNPAVGALPADVAKTT